MKIKDAAKFIPQKSTKQGYETITKIIGGVEHDQVIVKSLTSRNTGPVRMFSEVHELKAGHAEEYIKRNPHLKILKVFRMRNN